ncbi:MAG: hypothetical protein HUU35_11660 [Armatimonadetes bacterium]|nr:hypothetical protein [Armatimonadota bacterium]
MNRGRWLGWALALVVATATGARAQGVEFLEPDGGTVRGTVRVRVDMGAGYQNGFVVFYLGEPGKPLRFKVATVADTTGLFGFDWETQARDARVSDGEYRLMAVGYNAAGEVVGQAAQTVEVQNEVTASSLPSRGILLRYNMTPGRESKYVARGRVQVEPGQGSQGNDVSMFNGGVTAWWNARVLWRNADGRAQVRNTVYHLSERSARGHSNPLSANGKTVSLMMRANGEVLPRTDQAGVDFPFGELQLAFPREAVKVGDSWRSPMQFVVDGRTLREDTVMATHTLTGVEWHAGYRAAVIDSEFEGGPYRLELKGEDRDNEEWLADVTVMIKGKRRTYFAYQPEVGRPLRIEERQDQFCTLELEEPPPAPVGGMGDMGMGMAGPEMAPGPGGVIPGGAIPGAGVPGMPGVEAGGMAAPVAEKPAGFEKASTAFKRVKPKATAGVEATGTVEGAAAPAEPPKVDVVHFKRDVQLNITQDFLDPLT